MESAERCPKVPHNIGNEVQEKDKVLLLTVQSVQVTEAELQKLEPKIVEVFD